MHIGITKMKQNFILKAIPLALLAGLGACTVQKYQRSENLPVAASYRDVFVEIGIDSAENIANLDYHSFFRDPLLIQLIDSSLAKNNNLLVAIKQIEIASLGYKQSKWANVPVVQATVVGAGINRPSDNSLNGQMAQQGIGKSYTPDYNAAVLGVSWEADIWGKIKAQKQEALVDYLKTEEAVRAVKSGLVSEVAQGYYNLLMLDKQREVSQQNLLLMDSTLAILQKQMELGLTNALAVQQQEMTRDQLDHQLRDIESAVHTQENALQLLCGRVPAAILRSKGLDEILVPKEMETGVPVQLFGNRPDVRSSELEIRKLQLATHAAKVSMYPALNITAQGGLNAFKASNWFNLPGSLFGMAAGSVVQPVLQGKQLKTRYEQSKIMVEQAELNFKQSLLVAATEVSDALIRIQKLEEQEAISLQMVDRAGVMVNNSLTLFRYNNASYLEVILAQTNKLQADLGLATTKTLKLQSIANLYRALGGGWKQKS